MSYTIVRPKNHDEWLEERKKGIGSSDAGTIMSACPFSTPYRLWRQRLGLDPPVAESAAMRNGHILEPAVAEYFAQETNSVIDRSSEGDWLAVDDDRPFLRVSPDRLFWPEGVEHTPENQLILELKSTSKLVDPDKLPLYWVCQVQYQMGVMGKSMAAIAWLTAMPRLTFGHAWIPFKPQFFKTLTDEIDKFWNGNVLKKKPPLITDPVDAALMYPYSSGESMTASQEDIDNCREYLRLKNEINEMKDRLETVETDIKRSMKEAEQMIDADGSPIVRFKSVNEMVFDEDRFRMEMPQEYKKYTHPVFDKALLRDENKDIWKTYSEKRKGARRFSVLLKDEN